MSVEHNYQELYQQVQEKIKEQELILYYLYQERIKIRYQLLEQLLNSGLKQ